MKQRRPLRKALCECGRPVDRSLPTKDLQCWRCFHLNQFALAMHERTRQWLDEQEWVRHVQIWKSNRWFRRHGKLDKVIKPA